MTTPDTQHRVEFIARGVLRHRGLVLLCQNVKHGYFYLPGGHVEFGEAAAAACVREFLEETRLHVRAGGCGLIAEVRFNDAKRARHEVNVVFHVEHEPPTDESALTAAASREPQIAFEWVDPAALVDIDLRPRVIRAWLLGLDDLPPPPGATPPQRPEWISDAEDHPSSG